MEMHGMHGNARLKVNQCMLRWIVSGEHLSAGSCGLGIIGLLMLFQGDLRQSTIQRTACGDIMRYAEPEAGCKMYVIVLGNRYRVEMLKDWNNMASCLDDLAQEPPPMTVQEKRQARANSLD